MTQMTQMTSNTDTVRPSFKFNLKRIKLNWHRVDVDEVVEMFKILSHIEYIGLKVGDVSFLTTMLALNRSFRYFTADMLIIQVNDVSATNDSKWINYDILWTSLGTALLQCKRKIILQVKTKRHRTLNCKQCLEDVFDNSNAEIAVTIRVKIKKFSSHTTVTIAVNMSQEKDVDAAVNCSAKWIWNCDWCGKTLLSND